MPYTQSQLHNVSTFYRNSSTSEYEFVRCRATSDAVRMLRRMDNDSRWEHDVAVNAERTITCDECGEIMGYFSRHTGELVYRYEDEVVDVNGNEFCCFDCAHEAGYHECERCGEWCDDEDMIYVEDAGYMFCDSTCANRAGYYQCDRCEEWHSDCDMRTVNVYGGREESWCEHCVDYCASYCDGCEEYFEEGEVHYHEASDQYLCDSCEENVERDSSSNHLHYYSWTPCLNFHNVGEEEPLYLGVELETDGGSQRGTYCDELFALRVMGKDFEQHFYMTEDSSLDNGVEITGHPMTLKYHVTMEPMYQAIRETALRFGFRSHDGGRCGLHVHVNQSFFGKSRIARELAYFKLLRLLQRHERQFFSFSRRTSTNWCEYKTSRDYSPKFDERVKMRPVEEPNAFSKAGHAACSSFHSQCVGFRSETLEFRIFRGTLKWHTYYACLALVDGMCRAVKVHGTEWIESVTWYDLMDEVIMRANDEFAAACLVEYLVDKELR